jgi:hypothetical protein
MSETSIAGPVGGVVGDPKAPTTYVGDVDGGPPRRPYWRPESAHYLCRRHGWRAPREALSETQELPPPMSEMWIVDPWEALSETREHPPTYVGNVDGGPPRRHCQRPGISHHLCRRRGWRAPWEALSETQERPPPMSETLMMGPLEGAVGDPRASTTYVGDVDGGPPWEA